MSAFLGVISILAMLVFLVIAITMAVKKRPVKKYLIGLAAGFVLFIIAVAIPSEPTKPTTSSQQEAAPATTQQPEVEATKTPAPVPSPPPTPSETPEEYKNSCQKILYDDLARDTEKFVGKKSTLTGEVIQVMESGNSVQMRVNITKKGSSNYTYWSDTIFIDYTRKSDEARILEDDIIQVWGPVIGRLKYESTMGQEITIPHVTAKYLSVIKKRPAQ